MLISGFQDFREKKIRGVASFLGGLVCLVSCCLSLSEALAEAEGGKALLKPEESAPSAFLVSKKLKNIGAKYEAEVLSLKEEFDRRETLLNESYLRVLQRQLAQAGKKKEYALCRTLLEWRIKIEKGEYPLGDEVTEGLTGEFSDLLGKYLQAFDKLEEERKLSIKSLNSKWTRLVGGFLVTNKEALKAEEKEHLENWIQQWELYEEVPLAGQWARLGQVRLLELAGTTFKKGEYPLNQVIDGQAAHDFFLSHEKKKKIKKEGLGVKMFVYEGFVYMAETGYHVFTVSANRDYELTLDKKVVLESTQAKVAGKQSVRVFLRAGWHAFSFAFLPENEEGVFSLEHQYPELKDAFKQPESLAMPYAPSV